MSSSAGTKNTDFRVVRRDCGGKLAVIAELCYTFSVDINQKAIRI